MSGVNVLAVMDRAILKLPSLNTELLESLDEARSAVSELAVTQRETLRMLEAAHRDMGLWTDDNPCIVRARAALAPFEEQP